VTSQDRETCREGSAEKNGRDIVLANPSLSVSMSTVKRRLWGAGLRGRVAKKKPYLRLANNKKILRWAKEHRHWTEEICLEGQHPGLASSLLTLRRVFCGYYLMKLPVEDL
jgi:hypothetical protein